MSALLSRRLPAGVAEIGCWLAFYLTVHFEVNDEQWSFWLPMKFLVAVPQTVFCLLLVYCFGWLFAKPLDTPVWRLVLFAVVSFVLLHVVYYYALQQAQPYAPLTSVTHRRWVFFMAEKGPLYFLHNPRYLLTVSPFLFFSMVCLPIGAKLLRDTMRENERLAAARKQQLAWEMEVVRKRLNPDFLQQTLGQVTHLLEEQQTATAAEVTLKLAQVLRYTLYAPPAAFVPLQAELDAYLDYVQLQELRLQPRVEVTLRLTVEGAEASRVLAGILLPLTEAVLVRAASYCEIEVRVRNQQLYLALRADSGAAESLMLIESVRARLAQHAAGAYQLHQQQGATTVLLLDLSLPAVAPPVTVH